MTEKPKKGRGLEGWRVSKTSEKRRGRGFKDSRGRVVCLVFFSKNKSEGAKDFTTRETRETKETMSYILTTVGRIKL